MTPEQKTTLIKRALQERKNAYCPYSDYAVGAALLCEDGRIYGGCNIENASYGASNCAERTALFKAVSEGQRNFSAIAIAGGKRGKEPADYAVPCGICRQVMSEFVRSDFQILVVKSETDYRTYTMETLLPCGFGGDKLI